MGGSEQLAALARRDRAAFTALVAEHDAQLVRLCHVITGDAELARDAVQNAWHRLWRNPPRLRDDTKLTVWLRRVVANEARQISRRRRRGTELERATAPAPTRHAPDADAVLDLGTALARLIPEERELLALRYLLELSSAEMAEHLGISPEGVRSRLHRLINRLRQELDP